MKLKKIITILMSVLFVLPLSACNNDVNPCKCAPGEYNPLCECTDKNCGCNDPANDPNAEKDPTNALLEKKEIKADDQIFSWDGGAHGAGAYNTDLFYRNDLNVSVPDPSLIYITEGNQAGYFYLYGTGGGAKRGFKSRRSRDLINWEDMGDAFTADATQSWATGTFWAPEVIYYKTPSEKENNLPGKYYMFFSAYHGRNNEGYRHPTLDTPGTASNGNYSIGMAYSDNPQGPYVQFEGTNADGREMGLSDVYLETPKFSKDLLPHRNPLIDAHCFVDDDGEIYLYFSIDTQHKTVSDCTIWGMRLKDMQTPDYSTIKQLTSFDLKTVNGEEYMGELDVNNEGPYMIKHNGKYFLTFSHAYWATPNYSVAQAISDSPLGDFVKVDHDKGGQLLTTRPNNSKEFTEEYYDFMAGTGHHSFFYVGNELFIAYHALGNRKFNDSLGRRFAMDKVLFVNNGEQEIMYVNGPSWSLQPRPEFLTGYENIAPLAKVTAMNKVNEDYSQLTNGIYKNHNYSFINEFKVKGDTKIALTFPKDYDIKAVMVYNAFNVNESFNKIDEILFETTADIFGASAKSGYAQLKNIRFNSDFYKYQDEDDSEIAYMRPGGSAVAVLENDLSVKTIIITIKKSDWHNQKSERLALSDIVVLGKKAV